MKHDATNISSARFEEIIDFSSDAVIAMDEDRKIVLFNRAAEALFGYSEDEALGRSLKMLLPEDARLSHDLNIDAFDKSPVRARSMVNRSVVQGLTKSNETVPLDISIQKHPGGRRLKYSAICRDMTQHIESIERLEVSQERLSRAQRIAHIGHWEWSIQTGALVWSDEIYRIFGQDKETADVSYDNFLSVIHPEDRQNVADYVAWCVEHKMPYAIIHRIICPDGEEKVVREKGEIFCDEEGAALRMDGTVQDITESWAREEQLRQVSEQAEAANRAKSQFLATISHELRTPLNAIIGMSSMIEQEMLGPVSPSKYGEYISDIKNSGYHLLGHINNILDISNVEMNNIEVAMVEVSASSLINTCIEMALPLTKIKNLHITSNISEEIGDICVDSSHCKKILINLLSNAVKFSHNDGEIVVGIREDSLGENIIFSVQDFGVGIAEDDLTDLFKPFTQVNMDLSRHHQGVGLGLSVVKALAEAQQGHVDFVSKAGEGTLVNVVIPVTLVSGDGRWI